MRMAALTLSPGEPRVAPRYAASDRTHTVGIPETLPSCGSRGPSRCRCASAMRSHTRARSRIISTATGTWLGMYRSPSLPVRRNLSLPPRHQVL